MVAEKLRLFIIIICLPAMILVYTTNIGGIYHFYNHEGRGSFKSEKRVIAPAATDCGRMLAYAISFPPTSGFL
jgi:hypothetical protein